MITWWMAITVLGGTAVMAPAALAVALWLAAGQRWRMALTWCLLLGAGLTIVVISKIAFIGWGIGIASIEFAGFSGHAMRAAATLPVLMYVVLHSRPRLWRLAGVAFGTGVAGLIAVSRVVVRAHSVSEAVLGCALGLAVAFAYIYYARQTGQFKLNRPLVIASLIALMFTPSIKPVPTEFLLTRVALSLSGHERPFTRANWKLAARAHSAR